MPLSKTTLEKLLKTAFNTMLNISEGGDDFALQQVGLAIKTYISTGLITSTDTGAGVIPVGTYVGNSSGVMIFNDSVFVNLMKPVIKTMGTMSKGGDKYFATMLGTVLVSAISSSTYQVFSNGSITTPSTPPTVIPVVMEKCTVVSVGNSSLITTPLNTTHKVMEKMTKGGDDYYAKQLATAIDTFVKSLVITVSGITPASFVSKGKIS